MLSLLYLLLSGFCYHRVLDRFVRSLAMSTPKRLFLASQYMHTRRRAEAVGSSRSIEPHQRCSVTSQEVSPHRVHAIIAPLLDSAFDILRGTRNTLVVSLFMIS